MSYTLAIIVLLGIPVLIYIFVSIKRKKRNMDKHGENEKPYEEGKARDTKFR